MRKKTCLLYTSNHIRDGILAGTFAKGDELKEKNIGDELGVSRTPVREALRQLELEGLVSIIPNKGAFVEGVSTDDIRDIYEIRALLEAVSYTHLDVYKRQCRYRCTFSYSSSWTVKGQIPYSVL